MTRCRPRSAAATLRVSTRPSAADASRARHPRPATPAPDRERQALWAALAVIAVWGSNFSVQKVVFTALSPGGFLFARYLMMPVAAAALLLWRFGPRWPTLPRSELFALARLGLAGHLLHVGLVTCGIHWSTAFSSSLILACGPVFTLLILRWHGLEQLTRGRVAGVAAACAGVLVFLSDKLIGGHWQASGGDLTLLVAASFFSWYTVSAKPLIERHGGVTVMAYATLLGSVPVVLLSLPAGLQVDWSAVRPAIWLGLCHAALISAFLGWLVWGWVNEVRTMCPVGLGTLSGSGARPGARRTTRSRPRCSTAATSSSARVLVPVGADDDCPGAQKLGTCFQVSGYPTMLLFSAGRRDRRARSEARERRRLADLAEAGTPARRVTDRRRGGTGRCRPAWCLP